MTYNDDNALLNTDDDVGAAVETDVLSCPLFDLDRCYT